MGSPGRDGVPSRTLADTTLQLDFQLLGADRDRTVILQRCSPDLGSFCINCKAFYSPVSSVSLPSVYIPTCRRCRAGWRTRKNWMRTQML